ncbi:unnamed protein product, partial [Heterosigma akashiwo]
RGVDAGILLHRILDEAHKHNLAYNIAFFTSEVLLFLRPKEAEIVEDLVPGLKLGACQ